MSDNNNNENGLDSPIYLDYDVKEISKMTITHKIMLETIKELFEKDGFEKTGETYKGFTILRKKEKEEENVD